MSLVELAIKKMQAAARSSTQSGSQHQRPAEDTQRLPAIPESGSNRLAPGVVAEVVSTGVHRTLDMPPDAGVPYRIDKAIRVDRRALRGAGLMPPENQERALADQYRHIKRPLIVGATGRGGQKLERGQLIMMASAMPGEGKTFTSINLALSMALEKDISVLLVDADVAKPHISRTFGVDAEPGLLDVLRDPKMPVESVILPTDVPNLCILPAGLRSETATELLASHRMEEMVNHLAASDARRIVVIDSPPLLLTSESRALAHWVGQIVVVVRAGFTPQQAVMDAISFLGESKSIGLILNQSIAAAPGYYYGYGDASTASGG
jgi:exopolysaccharide/PEP-CTERM locus tyrosine autokinase